jgi:C4-dicarboxylate-specific signal transduction histidine kinase
MVAGIAHEVNQPHYSIMNYAKACSNVLSQDEPPLDKLREWCGEIALAAARAGAIIKRLRDFVRRSKPQRLPTGINEVVEESLALVVHEIRRRQVFVQKRFSDVEPAPKIDCVQIQQVLVNLLLNACEAWGENSTEARQLTVSTAVSDNFVEVAVADNGPGFADGDVSNLFEPFVTTKPQGLGMGLAISKTIVESHGGKIWAESPPGGGAVFHFTLPLTEEDTLDVR